MSKARITFRFPKESANTPSDDRRHDSGKFHREEAGPPNASPSYEGARASESWSSPESMAPAPTEMFDSSAVHPTATDYGGWNNTFEVDIARLERQIRDSMERKPDIFPWEGRKETDPVTGYFRYDPPLTGPEWDGKLTQRVLRRSSPFSWPKIAASALGAVMTGVLFGVFLLTMFSSPDGSEGLEPLDWPAQGTETNGPTLADQGALLPDGGGSGPADHQAAAALAAVQIPAREYAVLQNGVFSTPEGAKLAENDLKAKGLAPVMEEDGQHYVFVGVAPHRDDALFLSSRLQDEGVEVFVKTLTLPMVDSVRWNGKDPRLLQAFWESGDRLASWIVERSVSLMQKKENQSDTKEMLDEHQQWSRYLSEVSKGIPERANPKLQQMNQGMMMAVEAMKAYGKNASRAYLWQAQAGILQYLLAEKQLLEDIRADVR